MVYYFAAIMADNEQRNIAMENIKKVMYAVVVDRSAAMRAKNRLNAVLLVKWQDHTIVREHYGIVDVYACMMEIQKRTGMPEEKCKSIVMMYNHMQAGDVSELEVQYDNGHLEMNYMFFAMYKHPGGKSDMVYLKYKLTADAPPRTTRVKIGERTSGWWWWKTVEPIFEERMNPSGLLAFQKDKDSKAFYRYQALNGFADEGLIDRDKINCIN